MKHQQFKELLQQSLLDDIVEADRAILEDHLSTCESCRKEYNEFQRLHSLIAENKPQDIEDALLAEARQELRIAMRLEASRRTIGQRVRGFIAEIFWAPQFRPVTVGIPLFILGLLVGYTLLSSPDNQSLAVAENPDSTNLNQVRLENIRMVGIEKETGVVEIQYDQVIPARIKGSVQNSEVQKLITKALIDEDNAGMRLRTVNALATAAEKNIVADPAVKYALIISAQSDKNAGVRSTALSALMQMPIDEKTIETLLFILQRDPNPGMRINAINGLSLALSDMVKYHKSTPKVLEQLIQNDKNLYVRRQAKTILKEIIQL